MGYITNLLVNRKKIRFGAFEVDMMLCELMNLMIQKW